MKKEASKNASKEVFVKRRNKLTDIIISQCLNKHRKILVIVPNANYTSRSEDVKYQYRFDSSFYYLTGFTEDQAVLVMEIDLSNNQNKIITNLFCKAKNIQHEIWDGYIYGQEVAKELFCFDFAYKIEDFSHMLDQYLEQADCIYYTMGLQTNYIYATYDQMLMNSINNLRRVGSRAGKSIPFAFYDIKSIISNMRKIKDEYDIKHLILANNISIEAHLAAMRHVRFAKSENEIVAKLLERFYFLGASDIAYTPIVGSGKNTCVLHYNSNNQSMHDGDLLLVDAGCELLGYASDITRTYPVNGKFTKPQREIYEIVLQANKSTIDYLSKNIGKVSYTEINNFAIKIITEGLIELGLIKEKNVNAAIEQLLYKQFYMHNIGHFIGLDVHDVGAYYDINNHSGEKSSCKLFSGMCVTIEPGIYISPNQNVDEKYWNIGIRIEDDILLADNGTVNLTASLTKEASELEKIICSSML